MIPVTEVKYDAETGRIAIKTGPGVTVAPWFVFHPDHGGHYTDGVKEKVEEWPRYGE